MTGSGQAASAQYRWYMTGVASAFVPGGIQSVLFPYLVAVELGASADQVGTAQSALMFPGLVLVLFAGLLADRMDPRRILILVQLAAAVPVLVLAMLLAFDALSYHVLLGYAVVAGSIGILAQPARDALLNQVASDRIQHAVSVTLGLSYGGQPDFRYWDDRRGISA